MAREVLQPATDLSHPSQDTSHRFPLDQRLRRAGFRIHAQRGLDEAIWERDGKLFRQELALLLVEKFWQHLKEMWDKA